MTGSISQTSTFQSQIYQEIKSTYTFFKNHKLLINFMIEKKEN